EEHAASSGEDTGWPKIMAIGDYRWNVQCVDDAGNTGESDAWQVHVIDMTGPDIAMNDPDTVFRGDPVEISLEVTDISGVEAVTAELRDPYGTTQSIPLENLADAYTATVETTMDSALGTYTLTVYAVDTLNNSNTAEDQILMTYRYIVALDLTPASTLPGGSVIASGLVTYDNGSSVPEQAVTLQLPGETTAEAALGEDGSFSHEFAAPSEEGTYDVIAGVMSQDNGMEFTSTEQLTVAIPQQPSVSGGGGGGGGGHSSYRPRDESGGSCSTDWSCTAWSTCSGGEQERTCVDLNHCSTEDATKVDTRSCTEQEEEEEETDDEVDTAGQGHTVNETRRPLPGPEEHEIDATEEDEGDAAGIGKASGFMSTLDVSILNVIFALVLMTILVGTLYKYGWSKGDRRKRPAAVDFLSSRGGDRLGLESYLDDRAVRRGRF
ncbi:hypothetical protein KY359_05080, partial [Candidatus Woesearchaeota archaeon]|nr:hypothetical protein [Candidatus Woesearchaeota archaeon]